MVRENSEVDFKKDWVILVERLNDALSSRDSSRIFLLSLKVVISEKPWLPPSLSVSSCVPTISAIV